MVLNIFISECRTEHCEACFSRNYCTRCKSPYIAYRGRCIERCPGGLYYANYSKDCQERGLLNLVSLCNVTLNIFYTRYTMKFSSQYHIPNKIKSILYLDDNYEPSARHTAQSSIIEYHGTTTVSTFKSGPVCTSNVRFLKKDN